MYYARCYRDDHEGPPRLQTLKDHSCHVSRICAESAQPAGLSCMAELSGLLHDMGKATKDLFQPYLLSGDRSLRGSINHASYGAQYLCRRTEGARDLHCLLAVRMMAAAIVCHHRRLMDMVSEDGTNLFRLKIYPGQLPGYEEAVQGLFEELPEQTVAQLLKKSACEIRDVLGRIGLPAKICTEDQAFQLGMAERFLFSCLMDADRYDAFCFAAEKDVSGEPDRLPLWQQYSQALERFLAQLSASSDRPVDRYRRKISQCCLDFSNHTEGIFQLFVPTGGGKTFSSLRYALGACIRGKKRRIFYVAPFKSILEQNAGEIRRALGVEPDDLTILEHHSDVVDDRKEHELLTERWDAPIILTTMVQFLNTLFDGSSRCVRRMHSLADSVIILDEAQAIPAKCVWMLNSAVRFLAQVCHCSVVFCTATQPGLTGLEEHPLCLTAPGQMVPDLEETFFAFRRVEIVDETVRGPMDTDRLCTFVFEKLEEAENLLVILNTKQAALSLYRAVTSLISSGKNPIPVYFLTTALCPEHRSTVIREIRERLAGKGAGRRFVCISTQLIEAGVDLSFDGVIRSLAGLDSIAQAAGRCNRHGEAEKKKVWVVECAAEDLSRLPDLTKGKRCTRQLLETFGRTPERLGGDLLSPQAIENYYRMYYREQKAVLGYPIPKRPHQTLYDLLAYHRSAAHQEPEKIPRHILHQAFETAGREFKVIEQEGMDVIVPYGDGETILSRLLSEEQDLPAFYRDLRLAQRYTVHLFSYQRRALEDLGALHPIGQSGAVFLNKRFYDSRLGVQMQAGGMEFLNG